MRVMFTSHAAQENNRAGIGRYTAELLRELYRLAGRGIIHTFPNDWVEWKAIWWDHQSTRFQSIARQPGLLPWLEKKVRGKFLSLMRHVLPMPLENLFHEAIRLYRCDLYHEPNFIPLECDLPTVATVHDLSVLLHPHWHPPVRVTDFRKHFESRLKRCRHLFAISEFGRQQIVRHLGWPADKVSVTYMGVRSGLSRVSGWRLRSFLRRFDLPEGYLLHVGTLEPRKNVLMLLKAYCSLPEAVRERRPLVLVGGKGWNSQDVHDYLQREGRHKNVRWLGYVEDRHFAALYSAARALVFPTFYEGFGIPTIEMMACGGAVIASTAGAVAETVGGKARLIDPHDADGWRDALLRVCVDRDWWQSLRQGVEQVARPFTWRRCAQLTLDVYRRVFAELKSDRRAA
jgi:glycosyltransferase involved in cell wall biosynthesis